MVSITNEGPACIVDDETDQLPPEIKGIEECNNVIGEKPNFRLILQNYFDEVGDYLDLNDDELEKLQNKLTEWLEEN